MDGRTARLWSAAPDIEPGDQGDGTAAAEVGGIVGVLDPGAKANTVNLASDSGQDNHAAAAG
jgi:hypothetical protein